MNEHAAVATACGLDGAVISVEQIGRAWSNRLHRVSTTEGDYAVKELLNPWQDPHWLAWLDQASTFELAVIGAGVRAPQVLLNPDGQVITELSGRRFRVHRWIDGASPCPEAPVSSEVARSIGDDLATTHALAAQPGRSDCFPQVHSRTALCWNRLVEALQPASPEWAERAAAVLPLMGEIVELFQRWQLVQLPTVMSHGDLDPKNVVLGDGSAWIVDWDVAAPWRAGDELARTAASFAGDDPSVARELIATYSEGAPLPLIDDLVMTPDLVIGLDWIEACLRRAAGLSPCDEQRKIEAEQQAVAELDDLAASVERARAFPDWLTG